MKSEEKYNGNSLSELHISSVKCKMLDVHCSYIHVHAHTSVYICVQVQYIKAICFEQMPLN